MINSASLLHAELLKTAPITGVSIGDKDDKATWRIDFDKPATAQQKQAAQDLVAAFDIAAVEASPEPPTLQEQVAQLAVMVKAVNEGMPITKSSKDMIDDLAASAKP